MIPYKKYLIKASRNNRWIGIKVYLSQKWNYILWFKVGYENKERVLKWREILSVSAKFFINKMIWIKLNWKRIKII
jgi:hypothetical protein